MAIRHSTPADNSFTPLGKVAWDAGHDGDASDLVFVPSGTGAITSETVQAALRRLCFSGQYDTTANFQTQTGTLTNIVGIAGLQTVQATEAVGSTVLTHKWATSGQAPYQFQETSAANTGVGAGTYNHAFWFGYNVARHSSVGSATSNKPALIMGMEDNYYDDGGDADYGMEWYVEYFSPDGSSVTLFRPYYARIISSNNSKHGATIRSDIGTDGAGTFKVYAGLGTALFTLSAAAAAINVTLTCSNKIITGQLDALGTISFDTSADRFHLGVLGSLPSNSNGSYIGWATGITGTLAGDIILVPRTSIGGSVHIFTGSTDPVKALTVDSSGNVQKAGSNAGSWELGSVSELLTLSTSGTTTDTTANLLPANSIIEAVTARVTTTITTATDWKLGDATIAGRFSAVNATMTAGATQVGTVQADLTGTSGPRQVSAAKVRVTTTGTPGAGAIRITVYYRKFTPATS